MTLIRSKLSAPRQRVVALAALVGSIHLACASNTEQPACTNCTDALSNNGGASQAGSSGGSTTSGGLSGAATGGRAGLGGGTSSTGGVIASGGKATSGGTVSTGGAIASGGKATSGGTVSTGGATASGGKAATGGASTASGGSLSIGGTAGSGCPPPVVTGTVAQALVANGAVLLDVREPSEFAANGLPGAINIPLGSLPARMGELAGQTIVTYCASGTRSANAAAQLCAAGYNVYNLGALSNWPQ